MLPEHEKKLFDVMNQICMKDDEADLVFYSLERCGDKMLKKIDRIKKINL